MSDQIGLSELHASQRLEMLLHSFEFRSHKSNQIKRFALIQW